MDELEIVKKLQIMSNEFSHSSFFQHLSFTLDRASEIILNKKDCVEVVRCKDCMYYDEKRHRCDHPNLNYDVECYDQWIDTEPDDFCSYGERRSDNAAD